MKKLFKRLKFLIFGLLIYLTVNTVQAQYVTLEGRQFKIGTQDFYPVVCNYSLSVVNSPGNTNYFISRVRTFGEGIDCSGCNPLPNGEFECTNQSSAYNEITADFTKIHDMGFNTVRLGIELYQKDTDHVGATGFIITATSLDHPIEAATPTELQISPLYDTDPILQNILLPKVDSILLIAQTCSLKIILLPGSGHVAMTDAAAADYGSLLSEIADHLKNRTSLMAYDLYNEPAYNQYPIFKDKVCEYTALWYDAIKTSAPNHLITIGGSGPIDAWYWDPTVMKLDFYSDHIYPSVRDYENFSTTYAFDRVKGEIIWTYKNSPMPWIIGETGFSALDDWYYMDGGQWLPHTISPPQVHGYLTDQSNYATNSLAAVRNCGGSGYSWWNFQENWWVPMQDGLGLLRHGNLSDPNIDKPVVSVFTSYPSPPPAPQQCDYPSNYTDPDNWNYYSPTYPDKIQGTISENISNNGIEDAIFRTDIYYHLPSDPPEVTLPTHPSGSNTYTHADGTYILNPKYPGSDAISVSAIAAVAAGTNRYWYDWPPPSLLAFPINISLNLVPFKYDLSVTNEVVTASNPRNFQGWNTLTASNITIQNGAVSEFKARDGVTINGDFTAELGSDVYIYCTPTFPECNNLSPIKNMKTNNTVPDETSGKEAEIIKQLNVNFIPISEYAFLDVFPNPGNGVFTLNMRTNKEDNSLMQIHVYDITGSCTYKGTINKNISSLDLSFLSKGVYYLHATTKDDSFNQKLIIK